MEKSPAYYRARLEVFKQLISEEVQSNPSKDSLDLRVLRNGVLPGRLRGDYETLIKKKIDADQKNSANPQGYDSAEQLTLE